MSHIPNENLLQEFRKLNLEKKLKEEELDKIDKKIGYLKGRLLDKFAEEGQSSSKLDSGETVFVFTQYWAKPNDKHTKDDVMNALRVVGLGHLISESYNTNSLSAHIRELKRNKEEIPSELRKTLQIEPSYDIRIRGLK